MYCDSCIFVKLYFPEENSERVSAVLGKSGFIHCSELVITEFKSAIARKFREGVISRREAGKIITFFSDDSARNRFQLHPVSKEILSKAGDLIVELSPELPLRTLDAIHLSTCMEFDLAPIFSTDLLMQKASKKLGIKTVSDR